MIIIIPIIMMVIAITTVIVAIKGNASAGGMYPSTAGPAGPGIMNRKTAAVRKKATKMRPLLQIGWVAAKHSAKYANDNYKSH